MRFRFFARNQIVVGIMLSVLAAATVYALTAQNTVADSKAGEGAGAISGFAVTAITYTLDATTPSEIDAVSFTLDDAANDVRAQLLSDAGADGAWVNCTNSGGNNWTCDTTDGVGVGYPVIDADDLNVVAAQ